MERVVIDGIGGFAGLEGTTLGTSRPIAITQERIEDFCRAVDNTEWIHLDVERCRQSPLGTTIAPGAMLPALFSKLFFDVVEIRNIDTMLMQGSDRIRLLAPVKCGADVVQTIKVARVENRDKGIAVLYEASWTTVGADRPAGVGTFVVRYL